MANKEDILEQIVEDYLIHKGYFVRHNIKYLPRKDHPDHIKSQDSNHSDIDVLAINPLLRGADRIWAVSCKSWQSGFNPSLRLKAIEQEKILGGREAWKPFRELTSPKWSEAFCDAVKQATGSHEFTHVLAVTALKSDPEVWEEYKPFKDALNGNPTRIITLFEMLTEIDGRLTRTLAATEVGRMLQLFKVLGIKIKM
ncbi:MAG: hypothetical protein AAF198_07125 [Pseudomonadota bacterium]